VISSQKTSCLWFGISSPPVFWRLSDPALAGQKFVLGVNSCPFKCIPRSPDFRVLPVPEVREPETLDSLTHWDLPLATFHNSGRAHSGVKLRATATMVILQFFPADRAGTEPVFLRVSCRIKAGNFYGQPLTQVGLTQVWGNSVF